VVTGRRAETAAAADDLVIRVDGGQPPSPALIRALNDSCDTAEDHGGHRRIVVHLSGAPRHGWADGLPIAVVSKWERTLRRFERLPAATIGVASGDCGGLALDVLLAADYRIAVAPVRLLMPTAVGGTWPGMSLYRLARQAGSAAIRRAVLFGTPIQADDALRLRLIDELTDDAASSLAAAVLTEATPGAELAIRRQLMLEASAVSFEDALGVHLAACDRALRMGAAGADQ
jgi:isomerase DpgB